MFPPVPVTVLTTAIIALLCCSSSVLPCPVSVESSVMSSENALYRFLKKIEDEAKPQVTLIDRIIIEQMRRGLTRNNVLNINAMDVLDPVHVRKNDCQHENDHDGDMGREHADHMRDNGRGARSASLGSFVQIADALPKIEAPSIVPDEANENERANRTLAYLGRDKAEE